MSGRSTNGCWTCRLRKKKCDETRPSCVRCAELGTVCHKYGPRPQWMDRGPLQKEAARRLKSIVPRRRNSPPEPVTASPETCRPDYDSGYGTTPGLPDQNAWRGLDLEHELMIEDFDLAGSTKGDVHTDNSYYGQVWDASLFAAISAVDLDRTAPLAFLPDLGSSLYTGAVPSAQTQAQCAPSVIEAMIQNSGSVDIAMVGVHHAEASPDLWSDLMSPMQQDYFASATKEPLSAPGTPFFEQRCRSAEYNSPAHNQRRPVVDDDLLMDYFDRVFYVYFPFYTSRQQQSRGWLLSILRRESASYHAAMALAELRRAQGQSLSTNAQGSHHRLALQELQKRLALLTLGIGSASSTDRIGLLTSILHLFFYDMSMSGKHDWRMHLSTSAILLEPLIQNLPKALESDHTARKPASCEGEARTETEIAGGFLLSFFVCIDIVGSVSTRSTPVLKLDHKLVLELCDTDPSNLIGCDATTMICIHEIMSLDNWRQEMNKSHSLSLVELANRGRRIEKRLRTRLALVEEEMSRGGTDSTEVTRIFVLAAIIYLHVAISGAYPEIPEIASSVSETIEALHSLSDPKLLRSVVWPFCVSGCLATTSQEPHYRKLVSPSFMKEPQFGSCLESFEIMRECWEARKTGSGNYDWAFVIQKRQGFILW